MQVLLFLIILSGVQAQLRLLYHAQNGENFENLAVRKNGDIIFNSLNSSAPLMLSWKDGRHGVSTLPPTANITTLMGITEVNDDLFLTAGVQNAANLVSTVPGTVKVFLYDFTKGPVTITKVADIPEASLLKGAATIPPRRRGQDATVLFSDIFTGQIFHVDPTTGQYQSIFRREANSRSPPPPGLVRQGVNGVDYDPKRQTMYYANLGAVLGYPGHLEFGSVKLNIRYGRSALPSITTAGPPKVWNSALPIDDFTFTPRGTVYAAVNTESSIVELRDGGRDVNVLPNGTNTLIDGVVIQGPSSAQLVRRPEDRNMLYITTVGDAFSGGKSGGGLYALQLPEGTGRS